MQSLKVVSARTQKGKVDTMLIAPDSDSESSQEVVGLSRNLRAGGTKAYKEFAREKLTKVNEELKKIKDEPKLAKYFEAADKSPKPKKSEDDLYFQTPPPSAKHRLNRSKSHHRSSSGFLETAKKRSDV